LGCQAMKRLFALLRRIITLTTLAEALSAAAVYSAFWIAITALGLKAIYIWIVTVTLPAAYVMLTLLWYRLLRHTGSSSRPEAGLMVGSCLFIPLLFVLLAGPLNSGHPMGLRQGIRALIVLYCLFPLAVISITTYSGMLFGLALSLVSIPVTGLVMWARSSKHD